MPNIKPISDLRNYANILDKVEEGKPVFLTKNGRGCYAIVDINEYEEQKEKVEKYDLMKEQLQLLCDLFDARNEAEEKGYLSREDVINHFKGRFNNGK